MMRPEPYRSGYAPYPPLARRRRNRDSRYARRPSPKSSGLTPTPYSWLDGKGKAGPTERDFDMLQSIQNLPAKPSLELSVEEAFTLADKALKGYSRNKLLCITTNKTLTGGALKALPFQVFNELDAEFFRSALKENVLLRWYNLPDGMWSRTCRAGRNKYLRIRIELSYALLEQGHQEDILAALVHQMVHAYYLQCCGYRDRGYTGGGHDLEHEQPFQALLTCVGEHCKPLRRLSSLDLWTPFRRSNRSTASQDPNYGASCCYGKIIQFNEVDIKDWRDVAAAKTESLKEAQKLKESGPQDVYSVDKDGKESPPKSMKDWPLRPEACVLFRWENRTYPVPRTSVPDRAALTSSPCFKEGHLQLPPGTKEPEFFSLYHFVAHGLYPPSLKTLSSATAPYHKVSQGPPKIRPYDANAPTSLIWLVTAFHLGRALQYKPFCEFILKGLYSLNSTAENPIAVLEKIYSRQKHQDHAGPLFSAEPPDAQLRLWTKAWLAVELSSPDLGQYGTYFRTNLNVVRSLHTWGGMYTQLRASSPELTEDDHMAERTLVLKKGSGNILHVASSMPTPTSSMLPLYQSPVQHGPLPPRHPLEIPAHLMFPSGVPSAHINETMPSHPMENRDVYDMSGLSQYLPEGDRLQYVRGTPHLPCQTILSSPEPEASKAWLLRQQLAQEAMFRRLRASQLPDYSGSIFDQRGLSVPERPSRPY